YALFGVNEKLFDRGEARLVLARVDAIHGAHVHAGRVFDVYARFGDNVGHLTFLLAYGWSDRKGPWLAVGDYKGIIHKGAWGRNRGPSAECRSCLSAPSLTRAFCPRTM